MVHSHFEVGVVKRLISLKMSDFYVKSAQNRLKNV